MENMKLFGDKNNIYDAVDSVIENGIAIVEGTKTPAMEYANRIIKCLSVYPEIAPSVGYKNVVNNGYLYYVYDINKFSNNHSKLEKIIDTFDEIKN